MSLYLFHKNKDAYITYDSDDISEDNYHMADSDSLMIDRYTTSTMNYINSEVGTTCVGLAASMGSIILSSGEKGKRLILPHSRVLIHQPLGGCKGQASEIEIEYREIQKVKQELYEVLAANTGQTYDRIYADADRDHWFTALEAKEYGLVDDVIYKKK